MTQPTSEMIEAVAHSLCKACGRNPDEILNGVPEWVYRQIEAKAAIAEMGEFQRWNGTLALVSNLR